MKIILTDMSYTECCLWIEQIWTTAKRVQHIRSNETLAELCRTSPTTFSRRTKEKNLPELAFWIVLKLIRLAGYEVILTRKEK